MHATERINKQQQIEGNSSSSPSGISGTSSIKAQGWRSPNYPQKELIYLVFMSRK
jgi:hypothetical protein